MSASDEFKQARADRLPKGYRRKLRTARTECPTCWTTGGHDPRCPKVDQAAKMRAKKVKP